MTMSKQKLMHLVGFSLWSPSAHMVGAWRHPESHGPGMAWDGPEVWQRIAQDCERGRMDAFFFATQLAPRRLPEQHRTDAAGRDPVPDP